MRIALLFSGHLRTFEACYPNIKTNLLGPLRAHTVDIYAHVWPTERKEDIVRFNALYHPVANQQQYEAYLYKNGACHIVGRFDTVIQAAKAYDAAARAYHNYTAVCNFTVAGKRNTLPLIEPRQQGLFQIRDGVHRLSLAQFRGYSSGVPCQIVLNGRGAHCIPNAPSRSSSFYCCAIFLYARCTKQQQE